MNERAEIGSEQKIVRELRRKDRGRGDDSCFLNKYIRTDYEMNK